MVASLGVGKKGHQSKSGSSKKSRKRRSGAKQASQQASSMGGDGMMGSMVGAFRSAFRSDAHAKRTWRDALWLVLLVAAVLAVAAWQFKGRAEIGPSDDGQLAYLA